MLMLRAVFLHCWRICVVCLALELIGSWVVVGFSVGMDAFGRPLITYCSMSSEVFWCSQVLGLSLLPLDFSFILPVVSRLLQLYSTPFEDDGCFSGLLMSSASGQKLFCEVCSAFKCSFDEFVGEKVVSPSYFSAILALPSSVLVF